MARLTTGCVGTPQRARHIGEPGGKGRLVQWGTVGEEVELWVLHTSRRLQSPKVRAFVGFLCEQYPGGWFVV